MGVIITPQSEIDKYFESSALSQSLLKKLLGGIDSFKHNNKDEVELYYTEKGHFIIGSAVDTLLTGEEGEFDKQYYVSQIEKKPSEVEMSIIQKAFDDIVTANFNSIQEVGEIDDINYYNFIQTSIEEHNWQSNWKMETKVNKIIDIGAIYFQDLKASYGKQILSTADKVLIDSIVSSLVNNSRTSKYFDRTALSRTEGVSVYYQLPIYFSYKNIPCKALLDMLIVIRNESGKIVSVQPFDLKTMNGNTLKFVTNLKSFRYDIQAAWYLEALTSVDSSFDFGRDQFESENVLKPFTFIVESNSFPGQPLIFEADEELLYIGKFGKPDLEVKVSPEATINEILKYGVKGFDELVDTYIYQTENEWREEKIITDNDGVFKIGWNGIKD